MQAAREQDLLRLIGEASRARRASSEGAQAYATPRRLALVVHGLPDATPDTVARSARARAPMRRQRRSMASCAGPALTLAAMHRRGGPQGLVLHGAHRAARDGRRRESWPTLLPEVVREISLAEIDALGRAGSCAGSGRCIQLLVTFDGADRRRRRSRACAPAPPRAAIASWRRIRSRSAASRTMQ